MGISHCYLSLPECSSSFIILSILGTLRLEQQTFYWQFVDKLETLLSKGASAEEDEHAGHVPFCGVKRVRVSFFNMFSQPILQPKVSLSIFAGLYL